MTRTLAVPIFVDMTDQSPPSPEPEPLFTREEWDAATPDLTRKMVAHLRRHRTPLFIDRGDHGEGWGSGAFIEVRGRKYILTNEHVARVMSSSLQLAFRFDGQEQMPRLAGGRTEIGWPWDLALIPVKDEVWSMLDHSSVPVHVEQIAMAYTPVPGEVFAFSGFSGERTHFWGDEMLFEATTSLAREKTLITHKAVDERFHFGIEYLPDQATTVLGDQGLPLPPGFSGSMVWNTCFVEARMNQTNWTPDLARVVGVVWGWPSSQAAIVATKAEHLRSFLLAEAEQS